MCVPHRPGPAPFSSDTKTIKSCTVFLQICGSARIAGRTHVQMDNFHLGVRLGVTHGVQTTYYWLKAAHSQSLFIIKIALYSTVLICVPNALHFLNHLTVVIAQVPTRAQVLPGVVHSGLCGIFSLVNIKV